MWAVWLLLHINMVAEMKSERFQVENSCLGRQRLGSVSSAYGGKVVLNVTGRVLMYEQTAGLYASVCVNS